MQRVITGTLSDENDLRTFVPSRPDTTPPRSYIRGLLATTPAIVAIPSGTRRIKVRASALAWIALQDVATAPASPVGEVQTITEGDATGGTFTATFQGLTTGNLAFDISAAALQTALRAKASMTGAVACMGGDLDDAPIVVTFDPTIIAGNVPLITTDGALLTGGESLATRTPTVVQTTPGSTSALGHIDANTSEIFSLPQDGAGYLAIAADTGTGTWMASFY